MITFVTLFRGAAMIFMKSSTDKQKEFIITFNHDLLMSDIYKKNQPAHSRIY